MAHRGQSPGSAGAGPCSAVLGKSGAACALIVDDQPANVALLERLLQSAGVANVHGVTDPRQAVRCCLEVGADLVLLDLHMPHMDGFAVLSALRAALPDDAFVPVLVLTADSTTVTRDRALDAGAKDFVTKPFDHAEVILRVRNLLETRALYLDVQRHNAALRADLDRRAQQERRLAEARRQRLQRVDGVLSGNALTMVFQPIADLNTGKVWGVEALARFRGEPHRPPNEWFDEAAAVGRGCELELAAAGAALSQLDQLPPDAFLSVNTSPATAVAPELARLLERFPTHRIVLELTEHARVDDYEPLLAALDRLRDRGVRVAVDDAGAGYSGLQHVLRLRPDMLKLDTALTRGIDFDPARRALGAAMVSFGREIDAVIIAEGVETRQECEALRGLGIPWAQGYHLARPGAVPLPGPHLEALVNACDRAGGRRPGARPASGGSGAGR
ncbi:MAG: EAL domain-containing protein [Actinomycetota bacterium]|nr:EAL domain-containing protein [Actinomycetota bacterium]